MYRNGKEGQGFESPLRLEPLCDRGSKPQVRVARAAAAGRLLVTGGGVAQRQSKRLIIAVSRVRFPPPLRVSPPKAQWNAAGRQSDTKRVGGPRDGQGRQQTDDHPRVHRVQAAELRHREEPSQRPGPDRAAEVLPLGAEAYAPPRDA